ETLVLVAACFLVMVFSASRLNLLCLLLSPLALFLMTIYSYTKRFTWTCHLVLGITCACAPVGAWLAVTGKFSLIPLFFGAANCLWTAGFDIIYGSQDYEFDKANGLHSIPVQFGVRGG
ncbi:UbiA family prenyltransferase, partial [Clostridioides difficile]|nr:UbiA family prenyltransferase [Clostridioides difficile]